MLFVLLFYHPYYRLTGRLYAIIRTSGTIVYINPSMTLRRTCLAFLLRSIATIQTYVAEYIIFTMINNTQFLEEKKIFFLEFEFAIRNGKSRNREHSDSEFAINFVDNIFSVVLPSCPFPSCPLPSCLFPSCLLLSFSPHVCSRPLCPSACHIGTLARCVYRNVPDASIRPVCSCIMHQIISLKTYNYMNLDNIL